MVVLTKTVTPFQCLAAFARLQETRMAYRTPSTIEMFACIILFFDRTNIVFVHEKTVYCRRLRSLNASAGPKQPKVPVQHLH